MACAVGGGLLQGAGARRRSRGMEREEEEGGGRGEVTSFARSTNESFITLETWSIKVLSLGLRIWVCWGFEATSGSLFSKNPRP